MIRNVVLTFLVVVGLSSCYQPERDCSAYKTGSFIFNYEVGDSVKTGKFIRGPDFSVDFYEGKIDSASIRWFNDCEFVLQDLQSKVAIHYKITSTTDSSYTFQYNKAVKNPNKELDVRTGTAYKTD
jgi:hypothetical protein